MYRGRSGGLGLLLVIVAVLGVGCGGSSSNHQTFPTAAPTAVPAPTPTTIVTAPAATDNWTTYQNGNARLGIAGTQPSLTPTRPAWSNSLDGSAIYGQPLLAGGRVIVATEEDNVYALDPNDGRVDWQVNLGVPLRHVASSSEAGCGDIDPLGITSTPVVDPSTGTVYVVAEVSVDGHQPVHRQLVGIDIATGKITLSVPSDPPLPAGENPVHLLQRAALALGNGRVYIGYGGQFGDCGTYHGWVVAAALGGGHQETAFDATPDSTGGAVWDGGSGPAIGVDGSVYVTTGNPNSGGPSPWAEAAVKLPPELGSAPEASFQDKKATGDLDLATGGPELLPDGTVFAAGKTDIGYLLTQTGLDRVAPINGKICGSDPDGGAAYDQQLSSLYLPCQGGGIQQIDLSTRSTGWRAGKANSTPVLANGELWALEYPHGTLVELDPATGQTLQSVPVGRQVPHFASPSVVAGLILVPTVSGVIAFSGPSGPPPSTS